MLLLLCEGYSCENFWHYIRSFKKRKENILVPCGIRQGISECRTKSFANNFRQSGNVFSSSYQLIQNSAYAMVGYAPL